MFCPKCGSILVPKKDKQQAVMLCSCGYVDKEAEATKLNEKVEVKKEIEVVEEDQDLETLPSCEAKCPDCGHDKAKYWFLQTRAADEPETKFMKCEKCKHTWRDYN